MENIASGGGNQFSRQSSGGMSSVTIGGGGDSVLSSVASSSTAVIDQSVFEESAVESLVSGDGLNGNVSKKAPVWNKPSNVTVTEVVPVMGAESWPLLSESAKISTKSSTDSLKGLPDSSEATGAVSSPTQRQVTANANHNTTPNHTVPARQRSMRRNATSTSSNNGPPEFPTPLGGVVEAPPNNPSPRDSAQRIGSVSQSQSANGQPQQRNAFRNRNGNSHPRGDTSHHHNHGGRRDQDRGNQDWNAHRQDWNPHRNFNGRDAHMQNQRVVPRFPRPPPPPPPPPPGSAPFIQHSPVNPFGSTIGYTELGSPLYYYPPPEAFRGVPLAPQILPHIYYPAPDHYVQTTPLLHQIEYYFSDQNLVRDIYLRQNMDEQGWVPIRLIAGFNKVKQYTDNVPLILDIVRNSAILEVLDDKVRKKNDWKRWIITSPVQFANASNIQPVGIPSHDMLAAHVQGIALDERTGSSSSSRGQEGFPSRLSSGDLHNHSQLSSSED